MATIRPFAALLPNPDLASRICELPYDVMSSEEARVVAADNRLSFLHVSKPEIDLPVGTDLYSAEVYARGLDNFQGLMAEGALAQDRELCLYLYRQIMGAHAQTGIVAAASCQEYLDGVIKKHELTRPDKEDDRVRHIDTLNAQTGPVFLTYRARTDIDDLVSKHTQRQPYVDFTAADNVRHTSWRVSDPDDIRLLAAAFAQVPHLYIADGHHRSAAAARVYQARRATDGGGRSAGFLTVIFPHNQVRILPYNRVLTDLNGLSPTALLEKLARVFTIQRDASASPPRKHELGLFLDGRWHGLKFLPEMANARDAISSLDVTLLQEHVLRAPLGIDDPRTSKRIHFVGGIRGTAELEKLVHGGKYACAFSMFPTSIEDLMAIADSGGIMPPKSTWFEPKLRDAMFCLML